MIHFVIGIIVGIFNVIGFYLIYRMYNYPIRPMEFMAIGVVISLIFTLSSYILEKIENNEL